MKLIVLLPIVLLILTLGCVGTQKQNIEQEQEQSVSEDIGISEADIPQVEDVGTGEELNDTSEFGSGIDEEAVF
ncbi:MAG: hypothetical protein J7K68_06550 [Candidatus Diapherotrites archaeon]|nr:hypothetical protein [Candidatus Diapherotrites archaeon]